MVNCAGLNLLSINRSIYIYIPVYIVILLYNNCSCNIHMISTPLLLTFKAVGTTVHTENVLM